MRRKPKQVGAVNYGSIAYETKRRFISHWHQIDEAIKTNPRSILEIGKGSGFFSSYMKNIGHNIITLDIAKDLRPDIIGSVLYVPFGDNTFDTVVCCQVLEHLPYNNFNSSLTEICRIAKKFVIISLPQKDPGWFYAFHLPVLGRKEFLLDFELPIRSKHVIGDEHYWEIGKKNYPLSKIYKDMKKMPWSIERTFRVPENPYHRFFIFKLTS